MEGLRPGWAVKAIVVIIVTSILFRCVCAANHSVGGHYGWDLRSNIQKWSSGVTFYVGDNLVFRYTPVHDVVEVNQIGYATCTISNALSTFDDGETVIRLTEPGTRYFVCGRLHHCQHGLKLQVQVLLQISNGSGNNNSGGSQQYPGHGSDRRRFPPPISQSPPLRSAPPPIPQSPPPRSATPPIPQSPPPRSATPPIPQSPPPRSATPPIPQSPPPRSATPPIPQSPPPRSARPPSSASPSPTPSVQPPPPKDQSGDAQKQPGVGGPSPCSAEAVHCHCSGVRDGIADAPFLYHGLVPTLITLVVLSLTQAQALCYSWLF